jgi:hypothetical protein
VLQKAIRAPLDRGSLFWARQWRQAGHRSCGPTQLGSNLTADNQSKARSDFPSRRSAFPLDVWSGRQESNLSPGSVVPSQARREAAHRKYGQPAWAPRTMQRQIAEAAFAPPGRKVTKPTRCSSVVSISPRHRERRPSHPGRGNPAMPAIRQMPFGRATRADPLSEPGMRPAQEVFAKKGSDGHQHSDRAELPDKHHDAGVLRVE